LKVRCHVQAETYYARSLARRRRPFTRRRRAGLSSSLKLDGVNDKKLPAGFNVTQKVAQVLI
jgi:hypothetical protein